jgi:hypothetical protein
MPPALAGYVSSPPVRTASEDVLYEIQMFAALAGYLESQVVDRALQHLDGNAIVIRNALIEAYQLHARPGPRRSAERACPVGVCAADGRSRRRSHRDRRKEVVQKNQLGP